MADALLRAELVENIPELQDDEALLTECEPFWLELATRRIAYPHRHVHLQELQQVRHRSAIRMGSKKFRERLEDPGLRNARIHDGGREGNEGRPCRKVSETGRIQGAAAQGGREASKSHVSNDEKERACPCLGVETCQARSGQRRGWVDQSQF